jgi:hypothetical protein
MVIVGSEWHRVPHRFQALIEPEAALMTTELELVCEAGSRRGRLVDAHGVSDTSHELARDDRPSGSSSGIVIGVESVHHWRVPRGRPLTAQGTRVPLQAYANVAADLIAYIQLADEDNDIEWLVPRYVNEPIARLLPLSWMPDREPIRQPSIELGPDDQVAPGLYCLDESSFVRALRAQQLPKRRGRHRIFDDSRLPEMAALYNRARAEGAKPVQRLRSAFPHASRRTIDRAIDAARREGLIPPVGSGSAVDRRGTTSDP